jgi:hypothetical protein
MNGPMFARSKQEQVALGYRLSFLKKKVVVYRVATVSNHQQ